MKEPLFTFTAPTGTFYVRIHAVGPGGRSSASNEIRIVVNAASPPSAPADLLGVVDGSFIALTWRNTSVGGAPTGLVLDVTGSSTLSLPLGLTDRFTFTGVPAGSYTFAVRATNTWGTSQCVECSDADLSGSLLGSAAASGELRGLSRRPVRVHRVGASRRRAGSDGIRLERHGRVQRELSDDRTIAQRLGGSWGLQLQCDRHQHLRAKSGHGAADRRDTLGGRRRLTPIGTRLSRPGC